MLGSGWGGAGQREGSHGSGACGASCGESCSVHFRSLFFIFSLSVLLLLLFASFAVLLNCPYPDPRVLPFSFLSPPHPSGGRGDRKTLWPFVAGQGQAVTLWCGVFTGSNSFRRFPHAPAQDPPQAAVWISAHHDPSMGCRGTSALALGAPPPLLLL